MSLFRILIILFILRFPLQTEGEQIFAINEQAEYLFNLRTEVKVHPESFKNYPIKHLPFRAKIAFKKQKRKTLQLGIGLTSCAEEKLIFFFESSHPFSEPENQNCALHNIPQHRGPPLCLRA